MVNPPPLSCRARDSAFRVRLLPPPRTRVDARERSLAMSSSDSPSYRISRRRLLAAAGAATAFGLVRFAPEAEANAGPQSYTASWSSVDQHPPAPAWFQ